jgi:hypothetical protein
MTRFTNLGDLIVRDRDLDKVAVIDLGGEQVPREFSYAQLDAMSNAVARALLARGLKRGERVAILSANRAEFLAAYFGIMRAGLVAVPVNFKFPRQTIHFIMQDAGAQFVFCDRARRADCPTGLPVVVWRRGAESFDLLLILVVRGGRAGAERARHVSHIGITGTPRASCSRRGATSGCGDALRARSPPRYLIAAPSIT